MNINKFNNCSYDSNKIIEFLISVRDIYNRLTKDIRQYAKELEKFQDFSQRYDINNDTMLELMYSKLDKILNLFNIIFSNHLSITTSVRGIGDMIIKPVKQEFGTSTTIKYQNICNSNNKLLSNLDNLTVQTTINVATYDNITIEPIFENNALTGYFIIIGKLSYVLSNFHKLKNIKKLIRVVKNNNTNNLQEIFEQKEKITTNSIDIIFEFIDNQVNILADIESSLVSNIEYLNKYIIKFKNEKIKF